MLAQEKGQDRMPENVTHQSLNQVESFVESFATASCTQVMASQKNGRSPGCILRAISDGTRSCSPRFSAVQYAFGLRQQQMEVEHSGHMWTHWNAVAKMCKECTVEKLKSCFDKNSWRGTRECHLKSAHLAGRLQLCYSRLATMRCSQARQPVGNVPPKSFRGTKNLSAALEEKSRKRVETK